MVSKSGLSLVLPEPWSKIGSTELHHLEARELAFPIPYQFVPGGELPLGREVSSPS